MLKKKELIFYAPVNRKFLHPLREKEKTRLHTNHILIRDPSHNAGRLAGRHCNHGQRAAGFFTATRRLVSARPADFVSRAAPQGRRPRETREERENWTDPAVDFVRALRVQRRGGKKCSGVWVFIVWYSVNVGGLCV